MLAQRGEARLLLLPREPEVAEAHDARLRHLRVRPHAGVQAREHRRDHAVGEADPLAALHRDQLLARHALVGHEADRLVGADDLGAGVAGDALRAPRVVEVRVADEDPVAPVHVAHLEARLRRVRHAVEIGIEEDDRLGSPRLGLRGLAERQPERRAPGPVERRLHRRTLALFRTCCNTSGPVLRSRGFEPVHLAVHLSRRSAPTMEFGIFNSLYTPRQAYEDVADQWAVEAPAPAERGRLDDRRRQGRLQVLVGDRAPLPHRVLAPLGERGVPRVPARPRPSASTSAAASSTSRRR